MLWSFFCSPQDSKHPFDIVMQIANFKAQTGACYAESWPNFSITFKSKQNILKTLEKDSEEIYRKILDKGCQTIGKKTL